MARAERPLSPHLGVYRWQISNSLSILHRATGVMLSLGALVLGGWLITVAAGYEAYGRVMEWLSSPFGRFMLFAWTFCFFYHLSNGVRHLFWDAGFGFDKHRARLTGWVVVAVALILSIGLWTAALAGVEV